MHGDLAARCPRWLVLALAIAAFLNAAMYLATIASGETAEGAGTAPGYLLSGRMLDPTGVDSWRTMFAAYDHDHVSPGTLYSVFLEHGVKFQYPPSSLLVMPLLLPIWLNFWR